MKSIDIPMLMLWVLTAYVCFGAGIFCAWKQRKRGRWVLLSVPLDVIGWYFLAVSCGYAEDRALILDNASQKELVQILDAAAKAQGLALATPVSHIWEKLKVSPEIKEQPPAKTEPEK